MYMYGLLQLCFMWNTRTDLHNIITETFRISDYGIQLKLLG